MTLRACDICQKKEKREFIQGKQVKLEKEVYEARVQRHNRELERAMHEQEIEDLQREREAVHYKEYVKKEDDFQLRQIRTRSKLRINNNRGKPIDFLARYIYSTQPFEIDENDFGLSDDEENVDELAGYDDPLTIVRTTVKTVEDLEDILDDVKVYNKLMIKQTTKTKKEYEELCLQPDVPLDQEKTSDEDKISEKISRAAKKEKYANNLEIIKHHLVFWADVEVIIIELVKEQEKIEFRSAEQRRAINTSVYTKVNNMFENQTASKLESLKKSITGKIENAGPGVDIPYWEGLLQQLNSHEAKARLQERHRSHLEAKFAHIETEEQKEEMERAVYQHRVTTLANHDAATETVTERELRERLEQERQEKACHNIFKKRDYSPERLVEDLLDKKYPQQRYFETIGKEAEAIEEIIGDAFWDTPGDLDKAWQLDKMEDANYEKDELKKEESERTGRKLPEKDERDEIPAELREAVKNLKNDGFQFKDEINQTNLKYDWADKYRPRKPKYFNRVNTGFEWNRYNQTHYDYDTPPPKVVTGYKFNIYYPDLIDKRAVPTYNIFTDNTNPEYCILIVTAGPPYEDIAFRVVNKKIDTLERHGFMCEYRGGVFRLHFQYKKLKYKR